MAILAEFYPLKDSENAISNDLETQIFKIFRLGAKTMVAFRGSRAPKVYQASYP
jgi:hypothetical protein